MADTLRGLAAYLPHPAAPLFAHDQPGALALPWAQVFHQAGNDLQGEAHAGRLSRGIRNILAHVVIFRWNRRGIAAAHQAVFARAAAPAHPRPDWPACCPVPGSAADRIFKTAADDAAGSFRRAGCAFFARGGDGRRFSYRHKARQAMPPREMWLALAWQVYLRNSRRKAKRPASGRIDGALKYLDSGR
jgi:hypothetical protein